MTRKEEKKVADRHDGATQAGEPPEAEVEPASPDEAMAEPPEAEVEEPEVEEPEAATDIDVAALSGELNLVKDQLLRTMADFDNYRKRVARDNERMRQLAAENIMRDLLPVLDNLERALGHAADEPANGLSEGLEMVATQFKNVLTKHGLREIPALGLPFDPHVHDALMEAESKATPAGHVTEEFQKGYWLGALVLRPSRVIVSKGPGPSENDSGE